MVGHRQADPDRGQQQQQGDHDEDQREGDLQAGALALQFLVELHRPAGPVDVAQHARIHQAADEEIGVGEGIEPQQRADPILGLGRQDHHLATLGALHGPVRNLRIEVEQAG